MDLLDSRAAFSAILSISRKRDCNMVEFRIRLGFQLFLTHIAQAITQFLHQLEKLRVHVLTAPRNDLRDVLRQRIAIDSGSRIARAAYTGE